MAKGKYKRKRLFKQLRECPISESGLSTRVANILEQAKIHTMYDLYCESEETISSLPGIGDNAMEEIHSIKQKINI